MLSIRPFVTGDIPAVRSLWSRCEGLGDGPGDTPEALSRFLGTVFTFAADAIFAEGGTLDKFIGDAVMAFFGAPIPHPDHARRAIAAAAKGSMALIIFGLVISVPLIIFGATLIITLLQRFPVLVWAGAALLGINVSPAP